MPVIMQVAVWQQAMTAWYVTLVLCQFWNIWVCKTRTVSVFRHDLLHNKITLFGVALALAVMLLVTFVPFLQPIFNSRDPPNFVWAWSLPFTGFILVWTEATKWAARKWPEGFVARHIVW